MPILDQIQFTDQPSGDDPFSNAKTTLLKNLDAQLEAARLMVSGKPSSLKERAKWYRRHQNGDVIFCVKVQNKVIALQKSKPFAIAGDDKKLPSLIEKIIAAVKGGELDKHIQTRVNERQKSKRS